MSLFLMIRLILIISWIGKYSPDVVLKNNLDHYLKTLNLIMQRTDLLDTGLYLYSSSVIVIILITCLKQCSGILIQLVSILLLSIQILALVECAKIERL